MTKRKGGLLRIVVAVGSLVILLQAGCATSRGFGQDVQSLGRDIEDAAK